MKRYLKNSLVSAVAIFTLSMAANNVSAKEEITVYHNAEKVSFYSVKPIMENGRVLIPMRDIFEELGATVDWNNSSKTITAKKDGKTIQLKIGSKKVSVNELSGLKLNETIDVAPKIYHSKTMVPLRFVSESLGASVDWDREYKTVLIKDDNEKNNTNPSFSFVEKDGNYVIEKDNTVIGALIDQGSSYSLYLDEYSNLLSLSYAAKVARDYGFPMNDSEFINMERNSKLFEETPKVYEYEGVQYTSYIQGAINTWVLNWEK
ncbi:copper amine oxidase N-terminal domain-containing protein [Solibacillus sp. FSL W7-1464]|uniref:copper amine oxidase N-terminal domain-containing protein n=1 Tax=Solibacillus sp. FSL W7-1464 TaxID=2921706 RepID=UPI0030F96329